MNNRNVVLLILDTVSAKALKMYGGTALMPNLEHLSHNGTQYNMAIAPSTYTLPSHLSIFLGKRVRAIGGMKISWMKSSDRMTDPFMKKGRYMNGEITIAQMMEYFGYKSALFSNNPFVSAPTGLADGFSYVDNIFIDEKLKSNKLWIKAILHLIQSDLTRKSLIRLACEVSRLVPENRLDSTYLWLRKVLNRYFSREYGYYGLDCGADRTNKVLDRYLKTRADTKNFIVINYMEGHEGYPTNLVTDSYIEQDKWMHMVGWASQEELNAIRRAYAKRLEYLDFEIGKTLGVLKSNGILEDASVIITSDHGQAFMEHGQMFHNVFPYNEISMVPLVIAEFKYERQIRYKESKDGPFSLTNLNSMIAGRAISAGSPVFSDHTGITEVWDAYLLRLLRQRSRNADSIYRKKLELDMPATAIFRNSYKLIHYYGARKDEMYDMRSDICESDNIIDRKREIAHALLAQNGTQRR
ncbi:MAG: sulfatase-like hydrolase/transferase [Candidatus Marsarchaeota archaeon]|nr:sulfatase-like hydrolase/transferase [Candidatus Marsarchaeota archaeon]MCL5413176.1 sulfatase-like hydrolase/transferase [Candidatus Marsarchaeota archaeon]